MDFSERVLNMRLAGPQAYFIRAGLMGWARAEVVRRRAKERPVRHRRVVETHVQESGPFGRLRAGFRAPGLVAV
jgi:hypothetical protein